MRGSIDAKLTRTAVAGLALCAAILGATTSARADQSFLIFPFLSQYFPSFIHDFSQYQWVVTDDGAYLSGPSGAYHLGQSASLLGGAENALRVLTEVMLFSYQSEQKTSSAALDGVNAHYGDAGQSLPAVGSLPSDTIWWASASAMHVDESITSQLLNGTFATLRAGLVQPLPNNFSAGLGVGYLGSHLDAAGGQTIDLNGLQIAGQLAYAYHPNGEIFAAVEYNREYRHNVWFAGTDDYTVDRFTIDLGIQHRFAFDDGWAVDAMLDWRETLSNRNSSTDSTGFTYAADSTHFGRAALTGRVSRTIDTTELFAQASLGYITNDSSTLGLAADPWTGSVGAGATFALSDTAVLGIEGFAGIGRSDVTAIGGKLHFSTIW